MNLATEAGALETASYNGPVQYAKRLATYISDPSRIYSLTVREYGEAKAPPLGKCKALRSEYLRQREAFRLEAEKPKGYNPDNDNGESYKVPGLVQASRRTARREAAIDRKAKARAAKREAREEKVRIRKERDATVTRRVVKRTAHWFGLNEEDLRCDSQKAFLVNARWVAIRLMHEVPGDNGERRLALPAISKAVGKTDHTTTIHAIEHFDDRARKYPVMAVAYEALK